MKHLLDIQQYRIMRVFWEAGDTQLTIADLCRACPTMKKRTVERTLHYLLGERFVKHAKLVEIKDNAPVLAYESLVSEADYWESPSVKLRLSYHSRLRVILHSIREELKDMFFNEFHYV